MANGKLKVAILCDWLTGAGGAERVVLELHRMFPDAPVYTSQYDPRPEKWHGDNWFKDAEVRTGWLQKLPPGLKKFLPLLRMWYFSRLDLSGYDLVVSNNFGAESKAVKFGNKTKHICIMNAPNHYYWSRHDDYLKNPGFPKGFNWFARLGLKLLVNPLRRWDYKAAQKPTHLVAISRHIQAEIQKYYKRDSVVIHPPVGTARFSGPMPPRRQGFIIAGRQTPYKRVDLAVKACTRLNVPLTVIGSGPEHEKLRLIAGRNVTFLSHVNDQDIKKDFKSAQAFIFPGLDDFGIVAVEAMAAGLPVIAFRAGGALDYVIEGKTGLFFDEQTPKSLAEALVNFNPAHFNPNLITKHATNFSTQNFHAKLQKYLQRVTD